MGRDLRISGQSGMASPAEFDSLTSTIYFPLRGGAGPEDIIRSRERQQAESKLDVP